MNISQVKKNLGQKVFYNKAKYLFSACILRSNELGIYYQAELQDIKSNSSVIICRLSDVNECEESK